MSGIALPPEPKHDCRFGLPHDGGGYGSTGYPEDTVALCPDCGRAWVCLPCYESLGPVTWWRPVRWFSRPEIRRRATALARKRTTTPPTVATDRESEER